MGTCPRCGGLVSDLSGDDAEDRVLGLPAPWCGDCAARAYTTCSVCERDATSRDLVYCLDEEHGVWHIEVPFPWWQALGGKRDARIFIAEPRCWREHSIRVLNVLTCDTCRHWEMIGDNLFTGSLPDSPQGPFPPDEWRQDVTWLKTHRFFPRKA